MTLPACKTLLLEIDDRGVALCTFNRPAVRNALSLEMVQELHRALDALARLDTTALVFTGAGDRAFLGGADIAELRQRKRDDALARINSNLFRAIEQFPMPTLAAIRGFALGGGCELALACDIRICGEGAKLGQPEVSLGIIPGAGATYRLPRLLGPGLARELVFTGRIIDAQTALQYRLVNRVVPDDQVVATARSLAAEMAKNSRVAIRLAKQMLLAGQEVGTDAAMAMESAYQAILFEDADKQARMTTFLERKKKE